MAFKYLAGGRIVGNSDANLTKRLGFISGGLYGDSGMNAVSNTVNLYYDHKANDGGSMLLNGGRNWAGGFSWDTQTSTNYQGLGSGNNPSDVGWTLRFELNLVGRNYNGSSQRAGFFIGMSSVAGNTSSGQMDDTQDAMGILCIADSNRYEGSINMAWASDSAIAYSESGTEQVFSCGHAGKSGSGAVPENYYSIWVEINRTTDSTFNVKIFSDSDYKNLVASEYKTGLSGITNLRYINVESMDASGSSTSTAEFGTWLRDIRFYNNGRLPCNVEDGSYVYLQDTGEKFIYNDSIKDWEEV